MVERTCHQFLARSGLPQDQDRTGTGGNRGKNFEYPLHQRASADPIANPELSCEFLTKRLHFGQVAEGFHPSDHLSSGIVQQGRRNADGDAISLRIDDVCGYADDWPPGSEGLRQRAIAPAQAGTKDFRTEPPDRIGTFHAGDFFGSAVERRDKPLHVDGKNTVRDALQDHLRRCQKVASFVFFTGTHHNTLPTGRWLLMVG